MASIKIVRRKNKERKDGTAPLALRISENYKTNYNFTGQYITERDWDEQSCKVRKSHPNYKKINNYLLKLIIEANDISFENKNKISSKELKKKIVGKLNDKTFFTLASERIEGKFKRGTFSVAKAELSILYNIEEFLNLKHSVPKNEITQNINQRRKERISKSRTNKLSYLDGIKYFKNNTRLAFQDIDTTFISNYKTFCSVYLSHKTRTITNQLIFIRTIFNIALKNNIINNEIYPFAGEKERIRIKSSSHKIGLTKQEIERINGLDLPKQTSIWHTRNVWLISFYFAGIRISDVVKLKWSDFKDNRLYYVMNKNEKPLSLKVPEKAQEILNQYKEFKGSNNGYIFHYLSEVNEKNKEDIFRKTRNATKLFNKYLKRIADECNIQKSLSNHIARHSFGNIAGDAIHPLMLQKLYRHSDLKTTLNYQANFIHREADEALDSVINF